MLKKLIPILFCGFLLSASNAETIESMNEGSLASGSIPQGKACADSGILKPGDSQDTVRQIVCTLTNSYRQKARLPELKLSAAMNAVAQKFARRMEVERFFDHVAPDGSTFTMRLTAGGVQYNYAGENIAEGYRSSVEVMNGWMNSPGHRRNILGRNYGRIGIGHSGNYWVQVFAN